MATRKRRINPVHAVARATFSSHGFGHVEIHIYEMFRPATLKISCQTGGEGFSGQSYSYKYGIFCDHDVLGVDAMRNGYWTMRAIRRKLEKVLAEQGEPEGFAEFAARILCAADIKRIHVLDGVNPGYYGDVETLPSLNPMKQRDLVVAEIAKLERLIINKS